jgi:20S proteasome subunit alpha 7
VKGYYGVVIGKGKQAAKTEIEKLKLNELTCRQALFEVARMYLNNEENLFS